MNVEAGAIPAVYAEEDRFVADNLALLVSEFGIPGRADHRFASPRVAVAVCRAAALSVWFFVLFLLSFSWRVLGCGEAQPSRTCLCQAHA